MISQRHRTAEIRCQAILNYLHANPDSTVGEVVSNIDSKAATVRSTMGAMVTTNEIACTPGKRGKSTFRALVTTTASAESRHGRVHHMPDGVSKFARANEVRRLNAERKGHIRRPDQPIPNQGGQGAVAAYGRRVNQESF